MDHPRTCGENFNILSCVPCAKGSPPHLRGKQVEVDGYKVGGGITPAPAGKTPDTVPLCHPLWDHPRTCGENGISTAGDNEQLGSPPHLRGKH